MSTSEPVEKFDFQNMDVKLYLALRSIMNGYVSLCEDAGGRDIESTTEYKNAMSALNEFELSFGPLPDWAIARNWDYSLVPGAQLCTRDGRRTGNAHIIQRVVKEVPATADRNNPYGEQTYYECLTDAGSKFTFTEQEIETAFTIGDWISDPARVLNDFDRNGEFRDEQ
jgi:hypothetical protein